MKNQLANINAEVIRKAERKTIKLEVCPTDEDKFQLVRIALLLRDPNASYQDFLDLINPKKAEDK